MNSQPTLAAFDLDGTLVRIDTFAAFVRHTRGLSSLLLSLVLLSPYLLMALLGLYPRSKAKERLFSWHFRGLSVTEFEQYGREFASIAMQHLNREVAHRLHQHQQKGHTVCVVSASMDQWVRPICTQLDIGNVISTLPETDERGKLTGRFASPNCNREEKVNRLRQMFPNLGDYTLFAYGNSDGDKAMLSIADHVGIVRQSGSLELSENVKGSDEQML